MDLINIKLFQDERGPAPSCKRQRYRRYQIAEEPAVAEAAEDAPARDAGCCTEAAQAGRLPAVEGPVPRTAGSEGVREQTGEIGYVTTTGPACRGRGA